VTIGLNSAMRGPVTMLALLAGLYVMATATRRLFLSSVLPIADEETPPSWWMLDAAFLVRSVENIAALGFAILLTILLTRWLRTITTGRSGG
jgi:hypothetical protein